MTRFENPGHWIVLSLFFMLFVMPPAMAREFRITGAIVNGTNGKPAVVDRLTLYRMGEKMEKMAERSPAGPEFTFTLKDGGEAPLMLQAVFKKTTYNDFIGSAEQEDRKRTVTVFEAGAKPGDLTMTEILQIVRRESSLEIVRTLSFDNKSTPPRLMSPDFIKLPVPGDAVDLQGSLRRVGEDTGVPLELTRSGEHVTVDRGIPPGPSELTIAFRTDGLDYTDIKPELPVKSAHGHDFVIFFWRPSQTAPEIRGGEGRDVTIPGVGRAMRINYPPEGRVVYDFASVAPERNAPTEVVIENPVFTTTTRTWLGVMTIFLILWIGVRIFGSLDLRLVRRDAREK